MYLCFKLPFSSVLYYYKLNLLYAARICLIMKYSLNSIKIAIIDSVWWAVFDLEN